MNLLSFLHDLIITVAGACAPVIAYALLNQLHLQKDVAANAIVTTAITRGVGLMVDAGVKAGDPLLAKAATQHPALQTALNYVSEAAGPQLTRLNLGEDMVATKIASQLALTLHVPIVAAATSVTSIAEVSKMLPPAVAPST